MPRLSLGTVPLQVLRPSTARTALEIVFIPSSIIAGNTGLVFLKIGTPPTASLTAENFDAILNAGASFTLKHKSGDSLDRIRDAVWLISDTAAQIVTITEDLEE